MIDVVLGSVARHLPTLEVRSIAPLGEGMDNVAYEVNGSLVVRASKAEDADDRVETTRREAALLAAVAVASPPPVPTPLFADGEVGVIAYPKLPGRPLMAGQIVGPERLAAPLGAFLARLHAIPTERTRGLVELDAYPLTSWRGDAERNYAEVAAMLSPATRHAVEAFLARPVPDEPTAIALCHYDLGAEHILVDDLTGRITGIIDWTDAALVDSMVDLALVYRDLGPGVADLTYAAYAAGTPWPAADRARAAFYARCSILAELVYGLDGEMSSYRHAALADLDRTFA